MADSSGTYMLTGTTGTPITREAVASATVTYTITGMADTFNITGDAGSAVMITQTAVLADVLNLVANNGTITLNETQTADTISATVKNGGKVVTDGNFSGTSASSTLNFGTGGGSFILGAPGTYSGATLSQLVYGFTNSADTIDDTHLKFTGVTGYSIASGSSSGQQTIIINDSSGNFVFTTSGTSFATGSYTSLTSGPLKLTADSTGGTDIAACFLAGVRILTPDGEVTVERLAVGDLVCVAEGGETSSRPVKWIGNRTVRLADDAHRDAYPIRIRADAIAPNRPHRDLLVTSDHCVLVDEVLIPARMLVNESSIVVDTSISHFTFFHIELEQHAILIADGMTTESYLDTGNRSNFANVTVPSMRPDLSVHASHKSWTTDAAAPLAVDRETVEPIWTGIMERAMALGLDVAARPVGMTDQPDLRLLLDDGRELAACWRDTQRHMFQVPSGIRPIRLLSRAAVPAEVIGPFLDDRRTLGVAVDKLVLWQGLDEQVIQPACSGLRGWHIGEGASWTNGDAELDLPHVKGDTVLDVYLAATMIYRDDSLITA